MNKAMILSNLAPIILRHYKKNELIKDIGIFLIGLIIGALGFSRQTCQPQIPRMNAVVREQSKTDGKKETQKNADDDKQGVEYNGDN